MNQNTAIGQNDILGWRRAGRWRGGFSLIEATVAVVLLMVGMTTTLQAVSWMARQRQSLDRHALAIREAEHLLDRLVRPDADDQDAPLSLSEDAQEALPDSTISADRESEVQDGLTMERVTVTLRYQDRPGIPATAVRLRTWIMPRDETTAEGREDQAP